MMSGGSLRMLIDRNGAESVYRVSFTLDVPGRTLVAHEERQDCVEAVRDAFTALEQEFRQHKAQLAQAAGVTS